jgi:hypothetical protein
MTKQIAVMMNRVKNIRTTRFSTYFHIFISVSPLLFIRELRLSAALAPVLRYEFVRRMQIHSEKQQRWGKTQESPKSRPKPGGA